MGSSAPRWDALGFLTLREIRSYLRRSRALPLAVLLGVAYALGSMLEGGMLWFYSLGGPTTIEVVTGSGSGPGWWNYPGLLVVAPWGVLSLPFFATLSMLLVAAGVGLGMAVAAVLIYRLLRPSPAELARSKAVGAATGLTPAMISLVTLGSCCTTTAAATGGIDLIAQASGTTTANLLVNNWYLGVAQIAIVGAALLGQELLLTVYGGLLGVREEPSVPAGTSRPFGRRWALGAALRASLAVGGLLWSLSMWADWTGRAPLTSGPGWWFDWLLQHQLLAGVAVGTAFFPTAGLRLARVLRRPAGRPFGVALGAVAASLLVWWPAPLPAWGLDSLPNRVLGALGAPAAWGAIAPGPVTGLALVVRLGLEYLLPAGFVLALLLAPETAVAPLLATSLEPRSVPDGSVRPGSSPWPSASGSAGTTPEVRPGGSSSAEAP